MNDSEFHGESRRQDRQPGDPLVCACPVCARAKRTIKEAGLSEETGNRAVFLITEEEKRNRPIVIRRSAWTADGRLV